MLVARTALGRSVRRVLVAAALAVAPCLALAAAPSVADAQTTERPEFVNGTALTAKNDHALPRARIKAGTTGKVTKVYSSGGNIVFLDIEVAGKKHVKVAVAKVREHYDYVKL